MDRFKKYEESFLNSCKIVERNSKNLTGSATTGKGKDWSGYGALLSLTVSTEDEISEAEAFLAALEHEVQCLPMQERQLMELRVEECRDDFNKTCSHFRQAVAAVEKTFMDSGVPSKSDTMSTSLSSSNSRRIPPKTTFEMSSGKLDESRRIIAQTDEIGSGTISMLENQRYQLLDAGDKTMATMYTTRSAKNILTGMANRAFRWKAFLYFMVLFQLGCIVLVIYYGFVHKD